VAGGDHQQPFTFQWPDGTAKRRAVHHHRFREFVDGERPEPVQLREDRILRRPQALGGQVAVVDLADVAGGLAQGQAIALAAVAGHGRLLPLHGSHPETIGHPVKPPPWQ
jgi:hypothetical protein